jgi:tRNA dimethylallyltransferase
MVRFTDRNIYLEIRIGQFAKRQMTWFRRMEKRGIQINWVAADDLNAIKHYISR